MTDLKIVEREFIPVLFASDINTYSMARAFHEAYGVRSVVMGKYTSSPSYNSRIVDFRANEQIDQDDVFLDSLNTFAREHADKKIIAVGCGDAYVALLGKHKGEYEPNVIAAYIDYDQMIELAKKENFYKMCDQFGLDHPDTFIHRKEMGHDFTLPFDAPYILKPSDSVMYWEYPFEGQNKVFKIKTREELERTIDKIYEAGYHDSLIIQDMIPGNDSYMRVLTCYSDHNGKVQLMSLGHVLLEEHTPHGIGNHAVILNEVNVDLMRGVKKFLEAIHYVGFSNFDIKYDERDGKYKFFEINLRQGRSNFYVTGSGFNLAKCLVEDYIEHKEMKLTIADKPHLWLVVPRLVAYHYIHNAKAVAEMKRVIRQYGYVNPMFYKGDLGFKRLKFVVRNYLGHFLKYYKYK